MKNPSPIEWTRTTKYLVAVGLVIFGIFLLYISRSVVRLFIIGALIAFLISPIINFLNLRWKIPRRPAVLLSFLVVAVLLILAPLILIPSIIRVVQFFITVDYQLFFNNLLSGIIQYLETVKSTQWQFLGISLDLAGLVDPLLAALKNTAPTISLQLPSITVILNSIVSAFAVSYGIAVGVVGSVFSGALAFIFILLSGIYLSLDGDKLFRWLISNIPSGYQPDLEILLQRVQNIWKSYFRGEITLMLIIGFLVWTVATLLGLPGALPLAVLAGFLEIFPSIGPVISTIPAAAVALIQGSTYLPINNLIFMLIVIGAYILIQQIENYYILPRVMSQALYIHPLIIIGGILVGVTVGGVLGAVLATPIIATGVALFGYLYRRMMGVDPFPPLPEPAAPQFPRLFRWINSKVDQRTSKRRNKIS